MYDIEVQELTFLKRLVLCNLLMYDIEVQELTI